MPQLSKSILDHIGNTPLIELEEGILAKCEFLNPSGSIKARIAKYMIEKAEREGRLKPGDTIVEATSGNTGNAMSMVAAAKGYKMIVMMPDGFSKERAAISRAFGAEVRLVGHFQVNEALDAARKLGEQPGYYCPAQFDNEWNVQENIEWLTEEILSQLPAGVKIDAIVQGVGTGGTLVGVGKGLKARHNPDIKVYAMEPSESKTLACCEIGDHEIEGIADGFVPNIYDRHRDVVSGIIAVDSKVAIREMKALASQKGLFVGPSSGANYWAARELKKREGFKTVLTFLCDEGEKYIMQHFIPELEGTKKTSAA
jgi:cysteine synthase A